MGCRSSLRKALGERFVRGQTTIVGEVQVERRDRDVALLQGAVIGAALVTPPG